MAEEYSGAISFANSYFALVDGLAYGLEDHLAEDVRLDWFGKIVHGKRNVAAFMRINMTNSRHMFDEITPASSITQRKKRTTRRKYKSEEVSVETGDVTDALIKNGLNLAKLRIEDSNRVKDEKFQPLFTENIGACPSEKVDENSVKHEKNEEALWVPVARKMECASSALSTNPQNTSVKFVKANGIVHIHRSTGANKIRKWQSSTFVSGLPGQTYRRHCKLQVAYSWLNDRATKCKESVPRSRIVRATTEESTELSETKMNAPESKAWITKGKKRLNGYEEEKLETIVGLEASFNPFEDFDSLDVRQKFLERFEAEITPQFNFTSAKFANDRLFFDWTPGNESARKKSPTGLKFNYSIHSLVYESNTRSSLSEEFEDRNSLSDTEKSV